MKYKITSGEVQIDPEDLELVNQYKWHRNDMGYAVWRGTKDGKKQTIRMHRLIMQPPVDMVVDHINHNPLDNRRSNLRVVTQAENTRNRKNPGKGYWYHKQAKRWSVEVYGIHSGLFKTEEEAAAFAELVRQGKALKKPKPPERTHCKYGHVLDNPIIQGNSRLCRTCHNEVCKRYFKRKQERRVTSSVA